LGSVLGRFSSVFRPQIPPKFGPGMGLAQEVA
jgi:hypothetical protein